MITLQIASFARLAFPRGITIFTSAGFRIELSTILAESTVTGTLLTRTSRPAFGTGDASTECRYKFSAPEA